MPHAPMSGHDRDDRSGASRRAFLRGAGVTLSLPWLESLASASGAGAAAPPKRFAAPAHGLRGVNPDGQAKGSGRRHGRFPASAWCRQGRRAKAKINVVHGLFNKHATGVGIHPGQTGNILSGAALKKGAELKGGVSVDQMLARHLGEDTEQPGRWSSAAAADHRLPRNQLLDGL